MARWTMDQAHALLHETESSECGLNTFEAILRQIADDIKDGNMHAAEARLRLIYCAGLRAGIARGVKIIEKIFSEDEHVSHH